MSVDRLWKTIPHSSITSSHAVSAISIDLNLHWSIGRSTLDQQGIAKV
jgi:hypothetical protein